MAFYSQHIYSCFVTASGSDGSIVFGVVAKFFSLFHC